MHSQPQPVAGPGAAGSAMQGQAPQPAMQPWGLTAELLASGTAVGAASQQQEPQGRFPGFGLEQQLHGAGAVGSSQPQAQSRLPASVRGVMPRANRPTSNQQAPGMEGQAQGAGGPQLTSSQQQGQRRAMFGLHQEMQPLQPPHPSSTPAVPNPRLQPRRAGESSLGQGVFNDAWGVPDVAPVPYGFVAELGAGGAAPNPLHVHPTSSSASAQPQARTQAAARRALDQQLEQAGWYGSLSPPPRSALSAMGAAARGRSVAGVGASGASLASVYAQQVAMPVVAQGVHAQAPWHSPVGVHSQALPQEEPDYGLVEELKQSAPTDDPMGGGAFGLAAEVARRRQGRGSPGAAEAAGLPPMRPRKRPAVAPADFILAGELAAREAAAKKDPFDEANRASGRDPFVMADELIKFPTLPFQAMPPQDQELVQGPVPVKVPPEGEAGTTTHVLGDGMQYGLGQELGVDQAMLLREQQAAEAEERLGAAPPAEDPKLQLLHMLEWEPPGAKYLYDEDTGMLRGADGGEGNDRRLAREYIEDFATGAFYRLNDPGLFRRIAKRFARKQVFEEEDWLEQEETGCAGCMKTFNFHLSNLFSVLGLATQGLLGGFALLNFYVTYLVYPLEISATAIEYYAPPADLFARVYLAFINLALIASVARLCWDELRDYQPKRLRLRWVDFGQVLCYCVAYIATLLCWPLDYQLTYEYERNNNFYTLPFNSSFSMRLVIFNLLNIVRTLVCGLGFVLLCYQLSPYVFEACAKYEKRQRLKRLMYPRSVFDTTKAMYPETPPVKHMPKDRERESILNIGPRPTQPSQAQATFAADRQTNSFSTAGAHADQVQQ